MNVYRIISRCKVADFGCYDFSVETEVYDSVEEAKEDYPEFDETSLRAIEEYGYDEYYMLGTAKQIQDTYDSAKWYEMEGDEDEIRSFEEEFTYEVNNLE